MTQHKVLTNLITGFFGAGKTTFLQSLLDKQEPHEPWAVLLNDEGDLVVDSSILKPKADGLIIEEVPGGCICCSAGITISLAIEELIANAKPKRLFIELSGFGHPSSILVDLFSQKLSAIVHLSSVFCLVDLRYVLEEKIQSSQVFFEQVEVADVIVGSRADIASPQQLTAFNKWASGLPRKPNIIKTGLETIDSNLLNSNTKNTPLDVKNIFEKYSQTRISSTNLAPPPLVKLDVKDNQKNQSHYYSVKYPINTLFDKNDLDNLFSLVKPPMILGEARVDRIKGIFQTNAGWLLINGTIKEIIISKINPQQYSVLEAVSLDNFPKDWGALGRKLQKCIRK